MGLRLGYQADDLPITESTASRLLRLPLHTELTAGDLERVVDGVSSFFVR
jgi:dTDP-4-amino-4,6-dideoxygalactose transaminase